MRRKPDSPTGKRLFKLVIITTEMHINPMHPTMEISTELKKIALARIKIPIPGMFQLVSNIGYLVHLI
jgi:hypothetical protein